MRFRIQDAAQGDFRRAGSSRRPGAEQLGHQLIPRPRTLSPRERQERFLRDPHTESMPRSPRRTPHRTPAFEALCVGKGSLGLRAGRGAWRRSRAGAFLSRRSLKITRRLPPPNPRAQPPSESGQARWTACPAPWSSLPRARERVTRGLGAMALPVCLGPLVGVIPPETAGGALSATGSRAPSPGEGGAACGSPRPGPSVSYVLITRVGTPGSRPTRGPASYLGLAFRGGRRPPP
ncbi:uncharacterized protein [Saccopteryx bilineata]|uniref:uncharacterized protein n=1 Tax=Saccopteryx bilineata TaxID=59482 RepID=UPI0033907404